jgi:monovalent cation/hydrogen antiporter
MSDIEFLLGLLGVVAVITSMARATGVPYPIFLLLAGLGLGAIPGVPDIALDPDVVFLVFLPPLVHSAGYTTSPRQLREQAGPIGALALLLVAATIAAVAVAAHAVIAGLTWPAAFVLGAVVAPTDPVAATAIFRRLGVPRRVAAIVEGESLINDAAALVAFRLAVAATASGTFAALDGALELAAVSAGGVAVGLALAWAIAQLRRRLDDSLIEITVTLITPYVTYIVAEELHVSGILAAVASGVWLGARDQEITTPTTRLDARAFWGVLVFLLESTLFILVGLQFPAVLERLQGHAAATLARDAAIVVVTVLAARLAFVFTVSEVQERLARRRARRTPIGRRERLVVGWSGMRGAVSLAAALSIPLQTDAGAAFPGRDLIVFVTLAVIAVTVILQGMTLPAVVRAARLEPEEAGPRAQALARFRTVDAALEHIGRLSSEDGRPQGVVERARSLYAQRAGQLAGECRTGVADEDEGDTAAWLRLRRELMAVERAALRELRDRGEVSPAVASSVVRELDLEESRLAARQAAG